MEVIRPLQWRRNSEGGTLPRRRGGKRNRQPKISSSREGKLNNVGCDERTLMESKEATFSTDSSSEGSGREEDKRAMGLPRVEGMPHSMVLPLSPQSDDGDDTIMQDLDALLQHQATVLEGSNPPTPLSPSNLDSPPDSDLSDGEMSSEEPLLRTFTEELIRKQDESCMGSFGAPRGTDQNHSVVTTDGGLSSEESRRRTKFPFSPLLRTFTEEPIRKQGKTCHPGSDIGSLAPQRTYQKENMVASDDGLSDFEEVLSRSTANALQSQDPSLGYDTPESEEDELPAIDCYSEDSLDALEVNPDWAAAPPELDSYRGDSSRGAIKMEEQRTCLEEDMVRLPSSKLVLEHPPSGESSLELPPSGSLHCSSDFGRSSSPPTDVWWSAGPSTDARFVEALPTLKRPLLEGIDVAPYHVRSKKLKGASTDGNQTERSAVCFTTHMGNLVEACNEEGFISAAMNLMLQLTTTETYPPRDLIHFVLDSVLLDYSLPQSLTSEGYHVLERINRFHPLTTARVDLDWEWISNIVSVLVIEVRSDREAAARQTTSSIGESARERSIQALRFFEMVLGNDFQRLAGGNSDDDVFTPFVVERYMVKDIIDWLDQCISCYQPGRSAGSRGGAVLQELIGYLQRLLSLACQRDIGDHVDFISHNMVHILDDWDLAQKSYFVQTIKAPKLAQKLVEVYLETRYEVPSCAACRAESLRILPSRRLCVAKILLHHLHQRPLEATKATHAGDVYFEDEETGERVHPGADPEVERSEERHCPSCSKRVAMTTEQAEELVMYLMILLKSFLQCPVAGTPLPGKPLGQNLVTSGNQGLSEEDRTLLKCLSSHVESLKCDLLLSCPKLSVRTKLHLRQIALLGEKTS